MREPPTTAPTWTYDPPKDEHDACGLIRNSTGYILVEQVDATDDEMRLMAAARDLARALRDVRCTCGYRYGSRLAEYGGCTDRLCQESRALLASLPVLPDHKEK